MSEKEIYISVDIETDGPIPGEYSMLSLGAAAFMPDDESNTVGTFEVNLPRLDGAGQDPDTMKWWDTQKEAWEHVAEFIRRPSDDKMTNLQKLQGISENLGALGHEVRFGLQGLTVAQIGTVIG